MLRPTNTTTLAICISYASVSRSHGLLNLLNVKHLHFVRLAWDVIAHGGTRMSDKTLTLRSQKNIPKYAYIHLHYRQIIGLVRGTGKYIAKDDTNVL